MGLVVVKVSSHGSRASERHAPPVAFPFVFLRFHRTSDQSRLHVVLLYIKAQAGVTALSGHPQTFDKFQPSNNVLKCLETVLILKVHR